MTQVGASFIKTTPIVSVLLAAIIIIVTIEVTADNQTPTNGLLLRRQTRALTLAHNNDKYKSQKRDLGLIAIKAILLGPLIGLTIKAALVRGLLWALLAYGAHLFFPALLSSLGLGSGLVGFARQLPRPDYAHLLASYLSELHLPVPGSLGQMARQYQQVLRPVVDSIRAIPEGHCRYRAICETASQLVRQARSMSTTLQRISATVYMNFGTDYSKAWLDGVVQSDCAIKYSQCQTSPFSLVASRLAQSLGVGQQQAAAQLFATQAPSFAPQQELVTPLVDQSSSVALGQAPVAN